VAGHTLAVISHPPGRPPGATRRDGMSASIRFGVHMNHNQAAAKPVIRFGTKLNHNQSVAAAR
jgi:hypothetical protein